MVEELTNKAVGAIFTEFMTRYAKYEELVDAAENLLKGFYRELEIFRGAPLPKTSSMVDEVIKANCRDKLKEYVEADFTNHEDAVQNIIKLNSCKQGLEGHLIEAKVFLDELESLKCNAVDITSNAIDEHISDSVLNSNFPADFKIQQSCSAQEDAKESLLLDESMSCATLMTVIYGMLKRDYAMQEKIIRSLNLNTSSSVLERYCLFWEVRPDINENVLHQAWKYVSK